MDNALQHEWDLKSVDFPLTEDSVVFEIGGYEGRWAKEIAERYDPEIHIFEPQGWAFKKCVDVLRGYNNVNFYNVALGDHREDITMGNWETDGCSLVHLPAGKPTGVGRMVDFKEILLDLPHIDRINLCLMNIEGYEFKLIPYMIETGIMDKIDYFMCQFHLNSATENEYHNLRRLLGKTKKLRFDYGPILTCWEPK